MRFEVDPAERREPPLDGLRQIGPGIPVGGERVAQDVTKLRFHRTAVPGGADAQARFQRRIDIADGERGHRCFIQVHTSL